MDEKISDTMTAVFDYGPPRHVERVSGSLQFADDELLLVKRKRSIIPSGGTMNLDTGKVTSKVDSMQNTADAMNEAIPVARGILVGKGHES